MGAHIPKHSSAARLQRLVSKKIHPPLNRTPRESQQLLNVINRSFRQQLDKQHPPVAAGSPSNDQTTPQPRRTTATDKHLDSVLSHPLFSSPSAHGNVGHSTKQGPDSSVAQRKEPVVILREAMACGRADITTLHRCLIAQRSLMQGKPETEFRQAMQNSGFRPTLLSWINAATPSTRKQVFCHGSILGMALPHFCNAGMQETVIGWLESFLEQDGGEVVMKSAESSEPARFNFIPEFITAELGYGSGIVSALKLYIRICSMVSRHPSPESTDYRVIQQASRRTACDLTRWISAHSDESSSIPEALFHEFSALQRKLEAPRLYRALLALYHPTNPDPGPAMKLTIFSDKHASYYNGKKHSLVQRMCFRSSELCLEREQYANVRLLLEYAQELLPGKRDPSRILSSSDEPELVSADELTSRLDSIPSI